MSNCGFPDGTIHPHSESCYQAGRREERAEHDDAASRLAAVEAAAERASRKGYDLDAHELLELINPPPVMPLGSCTETRGCGRGHLHEGVCDA